MQDKYLVFDCSTLGNPKKWDAPHTDTFSWPHLVHLAYRQYDKNYNLIENRSDIVYPTGYEIPSETTRLSKISQEEAVEKGIPIREVLENFSQVVDNSTYLLAFNMQYNFNAVAAAFFREKIEHRMFQTERFCIMKESTYFCKIPGRNGKFKWPKLQELHLKLYGEKYENPNRADADAEAAANCLFKLIQMDEIDIFF